MCISVDVLAYAYLYMNTQLLCLQGMKKQVMFKTNRSSLSYLEWS